MKNLFENFAVLVGIILCIMTIGILFSEPSSFDEQTYFNFQKEMQIAFRVYFWTFIVFLFSLVLLVISKKVKVSK